MSMCATLYPAFERALKCVVKRRITAMWDVFKAHAAVIDSVSPVPRTRTSMSPSIAVCRYSGEHLQMRTAVWLCWTPTKNGQARNFENLLFLHSSIDLY